MCPAVLLRGSGTANRSAQSSSSESLHRQFPKRTMKSQLERSKRALSWLCRPRRSSSRIGGVRAGDRRRQHGHRVRHYCGQSQSLSRPRRGRKRIAYSREWSGMQYQAGTVDMQCEQSQLPIDGWPLQQEGHATYLCASNISQRLDARSCDGPAPLLQSRHTPSQVRHASAPLMQSPCNELSSLVL